jgi:Mor family transcriptional regulator
MISREYPEILSDMQAIIHEEAESMAIETTTAKELATRATDRIASQWAGQQIYIPEALGFKLQSRDMEIWKKYNGRNRRQLCQEYDITDAWLRKILKAMREESKKRLQPELFEARQ